MFAPSRTRAFSLIELVIVIVIIGIIAAIAIPRMSRGAAGAADSNLVANLARLRNAIDLFQAEHGGTNPSGSSANVALQLTGYSDATGTAQTNKDATHIYGPYLRTIPELPVGPDKGNKTISVAGSASFSYTAGSGWWYFPGEGTIKANCPDSAVDATNKKYNEY